MIVCQLDAGQENFKNLLKKIDELTKEVEAYAGTDQADLADGVKDDLTALKKKLKKAQKDSKFRLLKGVAVAVVTAVTVFIAVLAFFPRKAGAATAATLDVPAQAVSGRTVGPTPSVGAEFLAAERFNGHRAGYVFKKGAQGVGYYLDRPSISLAAHSGFEFHPTSAVLGAGMVALPLAARAVYRKGRQLGAVVESLRSFNSRGGASPAWAGAGGARPPPTPPQVDPITGRKDPSASASSAATTMRGEPAAAAADGGPDPTTMRASELKAAIRAKGGNIVGVMDKAELVALYRTTMARAAEPVRAEAEVVGGGGGGGPFGGFDPDKVDPSMMEELLQNPMMNMMTEQMLKDPGTLEELQRAVQSGTGMGDLINNPKFQQMARNMAANPEVSKMLQNPAEMKRMMDQMRRMGVEPPI